jgi:hypothetical protein
MIIVEILLDRDTQQEIEGLDPRCMIPQPPVQVLDLVTNNGPLRLSCRSGRQQSSRSSP